MFVEETVYVEEIVRGEVDSDIKKPQRFLVCECFFIIFFGRVVH